MSYYATVSHPFLGEYVYIRRNEKFKRLAPELHVVFADIVNKLSRTSGKCVQKLLVVSTTGILVLDHRTLDIKYRIAVEEIERISLSPFVDDLVIIHVSSVSCVQYFFSSFLLVTPSSSSFLFFLLLFPPSSSSFFLHPFSNGHCFSCDHFFALFYASVSTVD